MKRIQILTIVFALAAVFVTAASLSAEYLGNYCWNLAPYADNIEVAVTKNGGIYALHGVLHAPDSYSYACSGSAAADLAGTGSDFSLVCSDLADDPLAIFHIHANLAQDLSGFYRSYRVTDASSKTGTIVPIACPIPIAPADVSEPPEKFRPPLLAH